MYSTNAAGRFERKPQASVVAGAGRAEDNPSSERAPFRRPWSVAMTTLYDFTVDDIHGKPVRLDRYKGKVVLVVNTASECGFTPQYKGLEALYEKYKDRGLEVLGFPCNQFGAQEPGTADEIVSFCELNYGVTFPLFAKIDVNGEHAAPVYDYLKSAKPGLLGTEAIKWNFTKFLVGRGGKVIARFAPNDTPESIAGDIEKAL
jgi:glutathione peroxidase